MKALRIAVGLCWLYSVSCGVIKDQEEDLSLEAAENEFKDIHATTTALLNDEELKIVSLLERIQEKFATLDEGEKVEFVTKISDYQDRFTSALDKVEQVPGMYKLDVAMLRTNLGIPGPRDTVEEIHDPRDYDEVKLPDATVEIAPDFEATVSYEAEDEDESLARAASDPTISKSSEPERSLDDIYEVMTQIVQLVLYQIAEDFNKPEPVQVMPDYYYYPTPSMFMRSLSPSSRVRANKMKKSRKVRPRARPSPPMYGRQGAYNQDLAGILNVIPPTYDDVSVNYNYPGGPPRFPNKRHRRDTIDEDGVVNVGDEDDDDDAVIDIVGDSDEVNTLVEAEIKAEIADIEAEIIARQVAQEYAVWYERTYTPWHNAMMKEVEERQSYIPWFLNEGEDDDESEQLMSEEHAEALEQMALYKALMEEDDDESQVSDEEDDDESQVNEGDDQITGLEGVDQEIIENFNQVMEQLQENYLAMSQAGEDEE